MAERWPKVGRSLRWYSLLVLVPAVLISMAGLTWIMLFRSGKVGFNTFTEYGWLETLLLGPGRRIPEKWFGETSLVFWMEAPDDFIVRELAYFTVVDFLAWTAVLSAVFLLGRFCIWFFRASRSNASS